MKRFLFLNLDKLKNDCNYFIIVNLFLILSQCIIYLPLQNFNSRNLVSAIFFSSMHLYCLSVKKEYTFKDISTCFFDK